MEKNEKKNKITFISQWTTGKDMIKKAIDIAKDNSNYKIVFHLNLVSIKGNYLIY